MILFEFFLRECIDKRNGDYYKRTKIFHLLLYLEQNLLVGVNISWLTC